MDLSSIQKDLKATLYERLNSPFIGCFIISWILINYKEVLFFFFSNESINIKVAMLESVHSDYNTFILKRVPALRNHHFNHEILFEYFFFFIKRRIYFLISSTKWEATLHFYFTKTF